MKPNAGKCKIYNLLNDSNTNGLVKMIETCTLLFANGY